MARITSALAALFALALGACASTTPAPIVYAHAPAPVAQPLPPPPLPPRAAPLADLPAPPFDALTQPVVLADQPFSECVPFARTQSGVAIWGDAVTWWTQAEGRYPRSGRPAEGSVLVLRGWNDDKRGHVAVVRSVVSHRIIRVDHANWLHGGETSLNVPIIDVSPDNDWSEVRVWHIPGAYWGGRIYAAQGFIHPYAFPAVPPLVG